MQITTLPKDDVKNGTFNTGSAGEIHTGAGFNGDCKVYTCGR